MENDVSRRLLLTPLAGRGRVTDRTWMRAKFHGKAEVLRTVEAGASRVHPLRREARPSVRGNVQDLKAGRQAASQPQAARWVSPFGDGRASGPLSIGSRVQSPDAR
jgi:hypothetical protein